MDSDDIVERLRLLWTEPIEDAALYTAISEAADEIERLRAELNDMDEFIDDMPSGSEAFNAWQEARHD